VIKDC